MNRFVSLIVAICLLLSLIACGGSGISEKAVVKFGAEESGEFYFYGIVKEKNKYYVRVLSEWQENPDEEDYQYAPLAEEIRATFQPDGWVGAWCPDEYGTAKELAKADKDGVITEGAHFTYEVTDGLMEVLSEINYYEGNDVTGGMEETEGN